MVHDLKCEQVLRLLFTFSGKAHQDVSATAPVGAQGGNRSLPKQAASTEIEQEPTGCATRCQPPLAEKEKRDLYWEGNNIFSHKEVSLPMIPNQCIEIQTSPLDRPSVPGWFAEVVMIARHLEAKGLLEAFAQQVRLGRGRFGSYEPIDFLGPLMGYAISGERTLADFFERVAPFESAFMALFGRRGLPHRSSLSRFLADVDRPCLEAFRTLFEQSSFARCMDLGNCWGHL